VMAYWLPEKFGIDKRIINLSAQVMSGISSRESALEELSHPALTNEQKSEIKAYVLKKLDFTNEEFQSIMNSPNMSYQNYPNFEKFLFFIIRFLKPLIGLVYTQKPMTFVEMEMIDKNE